MEGLTLFVIGFFLGKSYGSFFTLIREEGSFSAKVFSYRFTSSVVVFAGGERTHQSVLAFLWLSFKCFGKGDSCRFLLALMTVCEDKGSICPIWVCLMRLLFHALDIWFHCIKSNFGLLKFIRTSNMVTDTRM